MEFDIEKCVKMFLATKHRRWRQPKQNTPWVVLVLMVLCLSNVANVRADPHLWRQEGWTQTDFSKHLIEFSEILSGGPGKDGIPPIDDPKFVSVKAERLIADQEAVIGLEINGDARAYPIRLLMWHEIANDTVGGVPVSVTYCPLCNAAIVFDRRSSGNTLSFGTTGKLRNSDLVMYDRQTESWWQQFSGEAIVGEMTGQKLRIIASRLEAFSLFKTRHPDGKVLVPNDPSLRAYGRNPYEGYDTSKIPFLFRGDFREGINPMARVVVLRDVSSPIAIRLTHLRDVKHIDVSGVTVSWKSGQASALDHTSVAGGRDVGNVVAQRIGVDGQLQDVPYDVTFAFVFHAFHPKGKILPDT